MPQQHKHIYIGLGTMVLLLGSALLLRKTLFRTNKKEKLIKKIDFKVFDSPDQVGSGKCIDPELVQKLRLIESVTGYPTISMDQFGGTYTLLEWKSRRSGKLIT